MTERIKTDAKKMKLLIREAEAVTDEAAMVYAALKQHMLASRRNPDVPVGLGQAALRRLSEAEDKLLAASTNLLRTHSELNALIPVVASDDDDVMPTDVQAAIENPTPRQAA